MCFEYLIAVLYLQNSIQPNVTFLKIDTFLLVPLGFNYEKLNSGPESIAPWEAFSRTPDLLLVWSPSESHNSTTPL